MNPIARYTRWLHTRWPAGSVEPLPEAGHDGSTSLPGVYVVGDLTGVPLLKISLDTGARAVQRVAEDLGAKRDTSNGLLDLVIVGAGVSGVAAAMEAERRGLSYKLLEAREPFSTIIDFPKAKPIYTYPRAMKPAGTLQVTATVKEPLVEELRSQAKAAGIEAQPFDVDRLERASGEIRVHGGNGEPLRARRVIVAIGRSGSYRALGVPGEDMDRVYHRLHDPNDFAQMDVLVVGGGDTAVETAVALAQSGARVTLAHRKPELTRPKPENREGLERLTRDGSIRLLPDTRVREIRDKTVVIDTRGGTEEIPNDAVFEMIGREAPLDFFRRSGIRIAGEIRPMGWAALAGFVLFCSWLYNWKSGGSMSAFWSARHWFPFNLPDLLHNAGGAIARDAADPSTLTGIVAISASGPAFWYTLAYSLIVLVFGIRRIQRRRTPYVAVQTWTLIAVQVLPLFLLPEILLPWMGAHGLLPRALADALFPQVTYGHGREYWRAYGLILAWPLNVYNIFTHDPLWAWIAIGFVQTFVLIPLGIYYFGKGFYCGWICSCGALAETLGDTHRHKMPHGPGWNRLNMAGQIVLLIAFLILFARIVGWILPDGNAIDRVFDPWFKEPYKWLVDVFLAGVVGYGLYFWFSGRVWCRFFCPLAALMHIYARFSRFAIVPDKKKCISCNVCTSVCHQGIDIMSFANKGAPMQDPECVRCSACVERCPTGVLQFGQVDRSGRTISLDLLPASPVLMREGKDAR